MMGGRRRKRRRRVPSRKEVRSFRADLVTLSSLSAFSLSSFDLAQVGALLADGLVYAIEKIDGK